jgi:glucan endo-1,3-alpha-glucosidase
MIGQINDGNVLQDISDAKDLGITGFAMNFGKIPFDRLSVEDLHVLDQFAYWSNDTVDLLFKHAKTKNFQLFFSFDHAAGHFSDPSDYAGYLNKFTGKDEYFKINGKALVSTFGGESVKDNRWKAFKTSMDRPVLVVPGFYQSTPTNNFFSDRGSLDGVFNWNSWLPTNAGKGIVSTQEDKIFQSAARSASKLFMMGISPIQYKSLSKEWNWYRRGEDNLEYRMGQVLDLQPDMLQLQTWNDAGESHYMGNLWPESMTTSKALQQLVKDRSHKGYWQILPAFIKAYQAGDRTTANMVPTNGKDIQGTFWHHTLTVDATCGTAELPKSGDIKKAAEDAVSGVILVAKGKTDLVAVVNVGSKELGKVKLVPGYNKFKFGGLVPGKVQVEVWRGSTMIGGGYGSLEVQNSATMCNYNFQVVGFPG